MKVIHGLESADLVFDRTVLSIGNFDGVHRGHQQLLAQGGLFAADSGVPLVVLTFEPHPLTIVRPDQAPEQLTRLSEKLPLLATAGADVTVVAESTTELLTLEAERFIDMVVDRFRPLRIVEGSTFGFGRRRRGTPEMLRSLGQSLGFDVCIIEPVSLQIDGEQQVPISSFLVRRLLYEGKVHHAALCLGRPYTLCGRVVSGAGRGAGMGFPTANIGAIEQLIPADGVYAGMATVAGRPYAAGISIGTNPTFDGSTRQVEAHLLDFSGDIREQPVAVQFRSWIREQRKFDSTEQLAEQIASDMETVRAQGSQGNVLDG